MKPFGWQCPYCNQHATITLHDVHCYSSEFTIGSADGDRQIEHYCIVCPNRKCRRFTFDVLMYEHHPLANTTRGKLINKWKLLPPARMKVFPEYVPKPIVDDYKEACSIVDLSPKAAATLARRCLQGMIRDFWKITKRRLVDEVDALKEYVDPVTWKAIDAVKNVGNIGAHMEKDIDVIIDIDPGEAEQLIGLIEVLVEDWYIARQHREERLNTVIAIGQAKKSGKS